MADQIHRVDSCLIVIVIADADLLEVVENNSTPKTLGFATSRSNGAVSVLLERIQAQLLAPQVFKSKAIPVATCREA